MEFFLFIFVMCLIGFLLGKIIDKLLGVKKKEKISETSGKNINRWGRSIIFVICASSLLFIPLEDSNAMKWYWMFFFIMLFGFESILEWKYLKNSKQYLSTLIALLLWILVFYNIDFFLAV